MEKTRVPYEKYWYITSWCSVAWNIDFKEEQDDKRWKCDNYFYTKEEAELMARKLRAVLKGAEVIEQKEEEMVYAEPIDAFYIRPSVENYRTPRE